MGIDSVELGRFDQRVGDGGGLAASFGADEEVVLAAQGDGAHATFGGIVVQFQDAIFEVGALAFHAGQAISDGCREWGFARDRGELQGQPDLQVVEHRCRRCLAMFYPDIWWRPSGEFLDSVELRDPGDGLLGDQGALGSVDVDELAPDMGHAGDLADGAGAVEVLEPGIAVGVHPAVVSCEVVLGVLALSIPGEPIPGGGRSLTAPGSLVAGVNPQPCGLGLAGAGGEHADGRVIRKDRLGRQDMAPDGICEGFGSSRAVDLPTQSARVERSRSRPSRSKIWLWR